MIYKIRNSATQQALPLPPGTHSVGRDEQSYIFIEDASVSRRHAIVINRDDNLYVEDLASANGTMLNKERIKGVHKLKFGDFLQFGLVAFVVEPETAPVPTAPLPVGKELPLIKKQQPAAAATAAPTPPQMEEATGTRSMKFFQSASGTGRITGSANGAPGAGTPVTGTGPLRRNTESLPAIRFDPKEVTPAAEKVQGNAAGLPTSPQLKPVSPRLAPRMSSESGLLGKKTGSINPGPIQNGSGSPNSGDISTPAPSLERGSTVPLPKKRLPSGALTNTPLPARRQEPTPPPPSARVGENGEIVITPQPKKSGVFEQYRVSPLPNGEVTTAGPKVPTSKLNFGLDPKARPEAATAAAPAALAPQPAPAIKPAIGGARPGSQAPGMSPATSGGATLAPAPIPPILTKTQPPAAIPLSPAPSVDEQSPSGTQPLPKLNLNRPTEKILPSEAMAAAEKHAASMGRDPFATPGSGEMSPSAWASQPAPGFGDPIGASPMVYAQPTFAVPAAPAPVIQMVVPPTPWLNIAMAFVGGAGSGIAVGLLIARYVFAGH